MCLAHGQHRCGADNAGAGRWGGLAHGHHGQHLCRGAGNAGTLGVGVRGVSPGGSLSGARGALFSLSSSLFSSRLEILSGSVSASWLEYLTGESGTAWLPGIINGFV